MTEDPNAEILTASEFAVGMADIELGKTLDYSINSLEDLEVLIQHVKNRFLKLKEDGKLTEQLVQRASFSIGGYLGEVIRRNYGGTWIVKNTSSKVLVINGQEFFPILYTFQRLSEDSTYSLKYYWFDINQTLQPQENLESTLPISEQPRRTANSQTGNRGLIVGGLIGIAVLCIIGILGIAVYSNIKSTNEFKAKLNNFVVEANKLNSMTEQGVTYQEFRAQLVEVKSAYTLIDHWPSSYQDERLAFDKALEGWNLTLDVWEVYLDNEFGFNYPKNEILLKNIANYLGMDSSKVDRYTMGYIPVDDWIAELLGKASIYFEAGKAE